jgi:hypothetical protein
MRKIIPSLINKKKPNRNLLEHCCKDLLTLLKNGEYQKNISNFVNCYCL